MNHLKNESRIQINCCKNYKCLKHDFKEPKYIFRASKPMSHSEGSTDRLYSSCKNLVTLSTSKLPETWFKACSSTVFDSVTVWLIHVKAKKDINNGYWASNPVFYFIQTAYFSLSGLFHLCRYPTHLLLWFLWGVTAYIILLHVSVKRLIPKVQIHVWKTKDAWKTSQRV